MTVFGKVVVIAGALWAAAFLTDKRARVLRTAMAELGPRDPDKYWRDVQPALVGERLAWCGGFALWVLRKAGLTDWQWVPEQGFLGRLPRTNNPQPGDIAYFSEFQHHAIVKKTDGKTLWTIDGNQAPGESVRVRERPITAAHSFYSIEPLVSGKAAA